MASPRALFPAIAALSLAVACAGPGAGPAAGEGGLEVPAAEPLSDAGEARYQLLVAEMALARGARIEAARAYLEAGRLSGDLEVLRRAAGLAYGERDLSLAEEAVAIWRELAPDDVLGLRYAFSLALLHGDEAGARASFDALRAHPQVEEGELLEWLSQVPAPEAALALLDSMLADRPDDAVLLSHALGMAEGAGDDARVLAITDAMRAQGTLDEAGELTRNRALERSAGREAALAELEAYAADELDTPRLRRRGELRFTTGDAEGAAADLAAVLDRSPADAYALYLDGEIALGAGALDTAEARFAALRELPGMHDLGAFMQARVLDARGERESAILLFDTVHKDDLELQAQLSAAAIEFQLGRIEAAMDRTDRLMAFRPDDAAGVRRDRAALAWEAGAFALARRLYQAMLADAPEDQDLRYGLALVDASDGRMDEAIAALDALVAESPERPDYLNALGYTLADAGRDLDRARALVRRALDLMPGNAAALDSMGWVEFRAGHLPAALGWLERAWEASRDPEIAAHLGEVLWTLGRQDDARAIWAEGARLGGDQSVLTETRERLEGAPVPGGVD